MRLHPLPLLLLLLTGAALPGCERTPDPAAPLAVNTDPAQAVIEASRRFAGLRAFHAEMTLHGAQANQVLRTRMTFVAPDRYQLETPAGVQTIIGDTLFLQAADRVQQMPVPEGLLDQWRSPVPADAQLRDATVEDRGSATLDGQAARVYRISGQGGSETLQYWIGGDGLLRQIQREGLNQGRPYRITLRYSRLNDPGLQVPLP